MVISKSEMKRKRKEGRTSPLLDESPKRTKVHAQRKFAQGSNVNSPVLTPVKELEKQEADVMPEPVELLPIKRPNTEDFLTFLCFRGTPILPQNLNFFNTASIVDTNGQVHEIKSESSPKNGPIDIAKAGSGSSEKPFVAFGVRKRADPIVISRQMDRKRRHALALQALRRKYQEQRMAKIRAVTISKLSEKVEKKTLVRSNSVSKTETITKRTTTIAKTKVGVVATKHVKVSTETVKTSLRSQIKPKMCLRSFRGRFVHKELPFRNGKESSEYSSDDEEPLQKNKTKSKVLPKVAKKTAPGPKKPTEINSRITRSNKLPTNKIAARRQQIKQRLLLSTTNTVKPRILRSQTAQKVHLESQKASPKTEKILKKSLKLYNAKKELDSKKATEKIVKETVKAKAKSDKNEVATLRNRVVKKIVSPPPAKLKLTRQSSQTLNTDLAEKSEVTKKKLVPVVKKVSPKSIESPPKKTNPIKKIEDSSSSIKEEPTEKTPISTKTKPDSAELKMSQRPTRKTKEAAAIYMEILSHKLVNDSKIDDDNVSIDSFPELPNVKRTEQRENELKAKAKSTKPEPEELETKKIKPKESESVEKKKNEKKSEIAEIKKPKTEEIKSTDESGCDRKTRSQPIKPTETTPKETEIKLEPESNKRKLEELKICDSDSHKSKKKSCDSDLNRRKTRNSSQIISQSDDDDSDESFHADVKIPRRKQITRSQIPKPKQEIPKIESSSESEPSTKPTSTQTKRFTKKVPCKAEQSFSDSDEEPLSKLTQKSSETKVEKSVEKIGEEEKPEVKPKRECAKRPQNYLPMFSSSDEEESYFLGFGAKPETKAVKPEVCVHPTTLDLSCKDIGRRFGKGKVNMSNEQIEKWLKDSAMAGSSVKNENDEMLKFGEKIPTETSHSITSSIDTEKLKRLLINVADKVEKKEEKIDFKLIKPTMIDRKLIFRTKDKSGGAPNKNAFSAKNESSVYAFGEEEDMKTPFRRPSRRPSSTATSKSEDESSKNDELSRSGTFRKPSVKPESGKSEEIEPSETEREFFTPQPQKPTTLALKRTISNQIDALSMVPPSMMVQKSRDSKLKNPKSCDRNSETSEEFKYKIPSSPSASSSSSAKLSKKQTIKPKIKMFDINPVTLDSFNNSGQLIEAPTFHPTDKEFQDPLEYIEKIRSKAEQFGICKIVPPASFKPECKVTDDMRFTAYNQYVHKMLHRWGPNFKELMAIKKYLLTQNISLPHSPWIGGMEIDLPRLYQTVQTLGGLKEVIEKKKWPRVSELMNIPKSAQDRVTKLDDIYCKYLLPYDTLSPAEREKLFDDVETEWAKRESKSLLKVEQNIEEDLNDSESESDDEAEECIVKGRSMALNAFYRIARNTMSMWFKTPEPTAEMVEQEFWKHVSLKQNHICVHSGSIDSGSWGYGFAVSKNSPFARHSWNLKVLTNNSGSVLRSLGPVMGVTVPTLHVGMVFSSCCWYREPHSLPWIEYLHTGANKIWYAIPNSASESFHSTLKQLVPNYCRNKTLWLPSDTVMVPPNLLVENGVSLCRTVQEPGQFIVMFPKVFTSSLSTGYVVSESVYFAPTDWLKTARTVFEELRNSSEPPMFSFDRLLLSIVNDVRSSVDVLRLIIPGVKEICDSEKARRVKIRALGVSAVEKLPLPDANNAKKKRKLQDDDGEYECEICRMNLFVSMVSESQDDGIYCLDHAVELIEKNELESKHCKLMYTYDDLELESLPDKIDTAITNKLQKKIPNKYAGMPTLLTT